MRLSLIKRKRASKFVLKNAPKEFAEALSRLNTSSVAIDLGANIGAVSVILADTGSQVFSFEPNPRAFGKMLANCKNYSKIIPYQLAAGVNNRMTQLFLHKDSLTSRKDLSQSSSLSRFKNNVSHDTFVWIFEIDFNAFISQIGYVDLIKVDIEGYEIELMNHMLDNQTLDHVGAVFVETHENKNPLLVEPTLKLKNRISKSPYAEKVFFNWH